MSDAKIMKINQKHCTLTKKHISESTKKSNFAFFFLSDQYFFSNFESTKDCLNHYRFMDKLTPEQRHRNMAAIHSKNTRPELIVRHYLHAEGFRFRLNHPRLPGHPDLVMRKYATCIFVNGCFWHGHHVNLPSDDSNFAITDSNCCRIPHTNRDFWITKIRRNQQRDEETILKLNALGWNCITIWECELKPARRLQTHQSLKQTLLSIYLGKTPPKKSSGYDFGENQPLPMAAEEDL